MNNETAAHIERLRQLPQAEWLAWLRKILPLVVLVTMTGCTQLRDFKDRHPVLTSIAIAAAVGGLAWNASTESMNQYARGFGLEFNGGRS